MKKRQDQHDSILEECKRLQDSGVVLPKEVSQKLSQMTEDWTDAMKKSDDVVIR